ncbi:MAG: pantoate--beta-alanine ligase [Clostridiales Family XIII bacterium]|jgi:pantoate--beta-alanine ligase|nr:pantoate--beta-alanine ligase [Clostridiales Family XIII bacterium]
MPAKTYDTIAGLRGALYARRAAGAGLSVGFVPTMGALHEGHVSLVRRAVSENDITVVSIFLNPLQFDESADLDSYPKTLDADVRLCGEAGADLIFCPSVREVYPDGASTRVEMDGPTDVLCGKSRPRHFSGVLTVVSKLFHIVEPDAAYFGEKDAQQLAVIRKLVRDLNMPVTIVGCPTVREADGLAMSSRNTHLNADERKAATCLFRALAAAREKLGDAAARSGAPRGEGEWASLAAKVADAARAVLDAEPLARTEYVELLDAETLAPLNDSSKAALCAIAVQIGQTRLIDNMRFSLDG